MALLPVDNGDDLEDPLAVTDAHRRFKTGEVTAPDFVSNLALALMSLVKLAAACRINRRIARTEKRPLGIIVIHRSAELVRIPREALKNDPVTQFSGVYQVTTPPNEKGQETQLCAFPALMAHVPICSRYCKVSAD